MAIAAEIIISEGPSRGLILSTERTVPGKSKSAVWCPPTEDHQEDPLGVDINSITDTGFVHLGSPVGNYEFVEKHVKSQVAKVKSLLDKLPLLKDPHSEFVLLKSCFSLPKISYTLRTIPTKDAFLKQWENVDCHSRESLYRILGSNMDDNAWLQAQLPVYIGGLGLRSAVSHSSASYIASAFESESLSGKLLQDEEVKLN